VEIKKWVAIGKGTSKKQKTGCYQGKGTTKKKTASRNCPETSFLFRNPQFKHGLNGR